MKNNKEKSMSYIVNFKPYKEDNINFEYYANIEQKVSAGQAFLKMKQKTICDYWLILLEKKLTKRWIILILNVIWLKV